MKLVSRLFCSQLIIQSGKPFTLVIENRTLFRKFVEDLHIQSEGENGATVLSNDNVPLKFKDHVDIMDSFTPFDINNKAVLSAVADEIFDKALSEEHYSETCEIMARLCRYIDELCFELPFSVECQRLDIKSVVKAAAVSVVDDYLSPLEKIIDYMSIRHDLGHIELFVTVNLSAYFEPNEVDMFMKTVSEKDIAVLMIECFDRNLPIGMEKLVIDSDLCEF